MNILVCDDDTVVVTMFRLKLSRQSIGEVTTAADCAGKKQINLILE